MSHSQRKRAIGHGCCTGGGQPARIAGPVIVAHRVASQGIAGPRLDRRATRGVDTGCLCGPAFRVRDPRQLAWGWGWSGGSASTRPRRGHGRLGVFTDPRGGCSCLHCAALGLFALGAGSCSRLDGACLVGRGGVAAQFLQYVPPVPRTRPAGLIKLFWPLLALPAGPVHCHWLRGESAAHALHCIAPPKGK